MPGYQGDEEQRPRMPLTLEDRQAFDKLDEAATLYKQYLEIAKIGQVPVTGNEEGEAMPPPINAPLTLVLNPIG